MTTGWGCILKGAWTRRRAGPYINQCINDDLTQVLEFLTPILHPEKPKVIVTLGFTIVFPMFEWKPVNWASILHEDLMRQVRNIRGRREGTIAAYLFHLYHDNDLVTKHKENILTINTNYVKYGVKAPKEPDDVGDD